MAAIFLLVYASVSRQVVGSRRNADGEWAFWTRSPIVRPPDWPRRSAARFIEIQLKHSLENARKVILPLKNGVLGTCRWQFERAPLAGAISGPHRDPRNLGRDGFLAGYQATQQGDAGVGRDAREEGARFSNLVGQIYALGDVQRRLRWDVATLAPGKAVAERCCVSRPFRPVHAARGPAMERAHRRELPCKALGREAPSDRGRGDGYAGQYSG